MLLWARKQAATRKRRLRGKRKGVCSQSWCSGGEKTNTVIPFPKTIWGFVVVRTDRDRQSSDSTDIITLQLTSAGCLSLSCVHSSDLIICLLSIKGQRRFFRFIEDERSQASGRDDNEARRRARGGISKWIKREAEASERARLHRTIRSVTRNKLAPLWKK